MAKEQKEIETNEVENEKFYLTDKIKTETYANPKLNLRIDFERDFSGNRLSKFSSPGKIQGDEFRSDKTDFLTGLTLEAVYLLGMAKVIKIKKSQRHYFTKFLNSINRKPEDE